MSLPTHYHEPESRLQQRDKLHHLIRFSDFVILIIGEDGVGKSALLKQLEPEPHQEQGRAVRLQLEEMTDVTGLLTRLTDTLDFEPVADNRERLQQLHKLARQLREDGLPLVLLIDDADFLTNNALELLVNFATFEKGVPPRVLLAGTSAFEERFRGLGLDAQLESHLHVERLEPFTADEAAEYVESLMPNGVELSQRQMFSLLGRAQGYPGALRAQVVELLSSGQFKPAREYRLPLPPRHIMAAIGVLLLVFSIAVWQYLPEDDSAPVMTERVSLPLAIANKAPEPVNVVPTSPAIPVTVGASDMPAVSDTDERPVEEELQDRTVPSLSSADRVVAAVENSAPEQVAGAAAEPELVTKAEPEVPPKAKSKPEVKAPPTPASAPRPIPREEPEPKPEPTPKAESEPTPKAESEPAPKPAPRVEADSAPKPAPQQVASSGAAQQWLREDELLNWPDQGYTLQVMGARSETSVRDFIKAQDQPQRFYYYRAQFKGAPWHVVVYGQYADRASALNAIAALPAPLRKLRPWARSIAGIKADIRKN